jgi:hypothetical protein
MYSAGVAAALALAEEIARSGSSSHKSDAAAAPSATGFVHAAAASVVRVRNGLVASREKSIDSSLVRYIYETQNPFSLLNLIRACHTHFSLLQRYKETELAANDSEVSRVGKEIDVILQVAHVQRAASPYATTFVPSSSPHNPSSSRHNTARVRCSGVATRSRVPGSLPRGGCGGEGQEQG